MPHIIVQGMHCANCSKAVTKSVSAIGGVANVQVDLETKKVYWEDVNMAAPASVEEIKKAIIAIGFSPE